MGKKYLKGFANLGMLPVTENTSAAYKVTGEIKKFPGARSCSPTDNREDFQFRATTAFTTAALNGRAPTWSLLLTKCP